MPFIYPDGSIHRLAITAQLKSWIDYGPPTNRARQTRRRISHVKHQYRRYRNCGLPTFAQWKADMPK